MYKYFIIICYLSCLGCLSIQSSFPKGKLQKMELAAINTMVTSPVHITEEIIMHDLSKIGYRDTITDTGYLQQLVKEVRNLVPAPDSINPAYSSSFLFSGLLYFNNSTNGIYLSFTGYEGKYYMYYNKELYEWNQYLANLIYQKLPKKIMDTVYDEIK